MATWFQVENALVGVSNKVGSSSFRRLGLKEFNPAQARYHCLTRDVRSILVIRPTLERLESAYNYFKGLGWPRLAGRSYRSIHDFADDLIAGTAAPDPHWAPQVPQHTVGGEQWWDWIAPFDQACEVLLKGRRENEGRLPPSLREKFSAAEAESLLAGPYAIDELPFVYVTHDAAHLSQVLSLS